MQSIDSMFVNTQQQQQLYNYAVHLCFNETFLPSGPYFVSSRFCEQPKPSHSYIGLISMAILSSPERQLVLSDIYQWILDHYPYFRTRGPGWRNSIRHNLSLNDCFIKAGRSSNGKGHFWSIHPANLADFLSGDFRRRRAQRRVRASFEISATDSEEISYYPSNSRKRCFDVDSLLAPDHPSSNKRFKHEAIYSPNSKSNSSIDTNLSM